MTFGLLMTVACSLPPEERVARAEQNTRHSLDQRLDAAGLAKGAPLFVRIFKEESELELWIRRGETYELFHTYPICNFSGELGPKLAEGDRQSPEGFYFVNRGRMNPASRYHLAFNIGYPNAFDRAHERTGSAIMVHGDCVSIGCYAMTDPLIEEIYSLADAALAGGQEFFRVHVFPFRMTDENMLQHRDGKWFDFWSNLREGYDRFERDGVPPNVEVREKRYIFEPGS